MDYKNRIQKRINRFLFGENIALKPIEKITDKINKLENTGPFYTRHINELPQYGVMLSNITIPIALVSLGAGPFSLPVIAGCVSTLCLSYLYLYDHKKMK